MLPAYIVLVIVAVASPSATVVSEDSTSQPSSPSSGSYILAAPCSSVFPELWWGRGFDIVGPFKAEYSTVTYYDDDDDECLYCVLPNA